MCDAMNPEAPVTQTGLSVTGPAFMALLLRTVSFVVPVRHIFQQLLAGPMSPKELPFFMATGAQTPGFAGQANDEFVPAACATRPCKT